MKFAPLKYNRPIDLPHSASIHVANIARNHCHRTVHMRYILWLMPFIFSAMAESTAAAFPYASRMSGFVFNFHFQRCVSVACRVFFPSLCRLRHKVTDNLNGNGFFFWKSLIFVLKYVSVHVYGVNALSRTTHNRHHVWVRSHARILSVVICVVSPHALWIRCTRHAKARARTHTPSLAYNDHSKESKYSNSNHTNNKATKWEKLKEKNKQIQQNTHTRFNNTCNLFHNWQPVIVDSYVH